VRAATPAPVRIPDHRPPVLAFPSSALRAATTQVSPFLAAAVALLTILSALFVRRLAHGVRA
jgi:hypothetical protein